MRAKVTRRGFLGSCAAGAAGLPLGLSQAQVAAAADAAPQERLRAEACVIGGGSAGIGAALAAARGGAKVVLLERDAVLGGTSTTAWVHSWEPCVGADGIPRDVYEAMKADPLGVVERDYAKGAPRVGGRPLPFEPRALIFAARELLAATGRCQVLLDATFYRARVKGRAVEAVEACFRAKRLTVEADVFIDCTADGDVCAAAGCEFHVGEDPKSRYGEPSAPKDAKLRLNACTLLYRVTDTGAAQKPHVPKGVREGLCPRPVCIRALPNGDHLLNAVNMIDGNALLHDDYAALLREAHRRVLEHWHWLQRLRPGSSRWNRLAGAKGYSTWTICGVAPRLGVRETRRILGDCVLTEHDCRAGLRGQKHGDVIAITDHAVDIHGSGHKLYEMPNGPYGVPYRCLLPKGAQNLLIASRAASFSHVAASSCRLSRTMMTLGQAAGTAAAICAKKHVAPRELDVRELQAALKAQRVAVAAGRQPGGTR
jgi:hypothetical protein